MSTYTISGGGQNRFRIVEVETGIVVAIKHTRAQAQHAVTQLNAGKKIA